MTDSQNQPNKVETGKYTKRKRKECEIMNKFGKFVCKYRVAIIIVALLPILLISFTEHPYRTPKEERGMMFTEKSGKPFKGYGMYAALSYDEGKTWPVKRLLTDGTYRFLNGGAWTQFFEMDENHAEPRGYLAGTQTPDNMIHLITSRFYYKFNLAWLKEN